MKNSETISQAIKNLEGRLIGKIKDRFIFVMSLIYQDSNEDFHKLDNLGWPNGQGILLSRDRSLIEKSFESAIPEQIPNTPYFVEIGHSKKDLKRLAEMIMLQLDYSPILRNEVKNFLEPQTRGDKLLSSL